MAQHTRNGRILSLVLHNKKGATGRKIACKKKKKIQISKQTKTKPQNYKTTTKKKKQKTKPSNKKPKETPLTPQTKANMVAKTVFHILASFLHNFLATSILEAASIHQSQWIALVYIQCKGLKTLQKD